MQGKIREAAGSRHLIVVRTQEGPAEWERTLGGSLPSEVDVWSQLMDFVLDVSRIGAWEMDSAGTAIRRSANHDRIFGYATPLPEWTHEIFMEHILPEDREMVAGILAMRGPRLSRTGVECRIRRADGEIRWIWTVSKPRRDPDGGWRIAGVVQDITERKANEEALRTSEASAIKLLSSVTELRDPYTAGHQKRVAELSIAIADVLDLPPERRRALEVAALLHDVGKVSVPIEILACPGKLGEVQRRLVEHHVQAGYEILQDMTDPSPVADIVLQHHERMDGSGYPAGLKGDEICLEARILAVADTSEAMSSDRPYRPAQGVDAARRELTDNRGTLYDAEVVDAYLEVTDPGGAQTR